MNRICTDQPARQTRWATLLLGGLGLLSVGDPARSFDIEARRAEVEAAERSFARSMAERDFQAFASHVAEDAVFYGPGGPLRGRQAVLDGWQGMFASEQAPIAWEPDQVDIAGDGQLAHSSGPVYDALGNAVTRFNSVWQRNGDGSWRVVFDRGDPRCPPAPPKTTPQVE